MRTTLDLPDPVFRRLKAQAALEGLSLKDLIARYVTAGLQRREESRGDRVSEPTFDRGPDVEHFVTAFDVLEDGSGIVHSGEPDLATNPEHLEGFGRD